ncbi:MAG: carboxypeptidase-like regulatory domain-containing protein [Candidatus Sericytochromatia bacterium]|nr:carboxypeptidase-like regulatory domain-containing protein [Candidatus Sericytochromatia bacterium]
MRPRSSARLLPAVAVALAAACASPVLPKPSLLNVNEQFAAILTDGTARLIGRARIPVASADGRSVTEVPAAGARVVLLDTDFKTTVSVAIADANGQFQIDDVPRGGASILRITLTGATSQTVEKLVYPTTSVECVTVDLASSLVVDKIAANGLLKPDPSLEGRSDLLDLVKPDKLAAFEEELRDKIATLPPAEIAPLLPETLKPTDPDAIKATPSPGPGGAPTAPGSILDKIGSEDEQVADNYNDIFVRPEDASLVFRISAVGTNAGVPKGAQRISGLVDVALTGMPSDVTLCEVWTIIPSRRLLCTVTGEGNWKGRFDSWPMPLGPTNLDFIGHAASGKRVLQRLPVIVDNSVSNLCKE